ncbi:MAG: hypothetical protein JNM63_11045, partial [Spirochaetia bacterium]|nr:hypothetical protein [Spirochaetia bacterium]
VAPGRSVEVLEVKSRPEFGSKTYRADLKSEAGADSVSGKWHTVVVDERSGKIFVNGEVFIVKGLNGHLLWSEPVRQDLAELLQDVNVNFLRPPQGAHLWFKGYEKYSSVMLCPVVSGYFSCKEIGDWKQMVPKKSFTFEDSATNELDDYIRSASESPLLFGWNTANEIATGNKPENEKALVAILEMMRSRIRNLDGYARPAIYANLMWNDQRITEGQDVCGFNYYVDPDSFDFNILKDLCKDKPFVFTETDLPSGYWKPPFWNNTGLHISYQTKLYTKMLAAGGSGVMLYSGLFDYFNRHIGLLGGDWHKAHVTLADLKVNPEYREWLRWLYRDFDYEAAGGKIKIKNLMPYALAHFKLTGSRGSTEEVASIPAGGEVTLNLAGNEGVVRAIYDTHSGLKHNTSFDPAKRYILPTPDLGEVQKPLVRKNFEWKQAQSINGESANGLKSLEGFSKNAQASAVENMNDPKEGAVVKLSFQFGTEGLRNDWVRYTMKPSVADVSEWDGIAIRIKNDGKVRRVNMVLFDEAGKPADIWSNPPLFEKDWQTVTFFFKNKEQLREN